MAVKYNSKVIQFNPTSATEATLTTALNNQGADGWQFVQAMLVTSTKAFALFIKTIAE
jgi:hypothetical protein